MNTANCGNSHKMPPLKSETRGIKHVPQAQELEHYRGTIMDKAHDLSASFYLIIVDYSKGLSEMKLLTFTGSLNKRHIID